jgi:hypothetical protein
LQSVSGASAVNPLIIFYNINGENGKVQFFSIGQDTQHIQQLKNISRSAQVRGLTDIATIWQ